MISITLFRRRVIRHVFSPITDHVSCMFDSLQKGDKYTYNQECINRQRKNSVAQIFVVGSGE